MAKRSLSIFTILLGMAFFWNVGVESDFASDASIFPTPSISTSSISSDFETSDTDPAGRSTVAGVFRWSLPSACLNGESGAGRQLSSSQGRLTLLVRLLGGGGNARLGSFSRVDDIRSYYGLVRPHLYFCRLLI